MIKRKLLLITLIWQMTCSNISLATTSSGVNTEFVPASKNLGIGIQTPITKLDINGQIMIRGGSPGTGKILSSDANGKASWVSATVATDATTLDSIDSLQFLRSDTTDNFTSGVLTTDSGTRFDVNGDISIADTDISLDGANTSFTQTTGNISLIPATGEDLNSTIASGGEFKINTSDFVFNGANSRIGMGTANPSTKLDVNGTIKGLTINGSSANFSNLSTSSLTNTGTTNFSKVIVSNNVNGATGNFTTGNFSNVIVSGIFNGTSSSFDGDFTNGSVFFSNANGVISEDNSHLFWDNSNKRLAINHKQPDMALDANGAMVLRNINDQNGSSGGAGVTFESASNSGSNFNAGGNTWANSITLDKPSGTVDGDLLLLFYGEEAAASIFTSPPSGWTMIDKLNSLGGGNAVFYKIASGEPSSYTFGAGAPMSERYGVILRYSGVDTSNPIHISATTNGLSNSTPTINTASVTTSISNTKIVKFGLIAHSCYACAVLPGTPSGYTSRATNSNYNEQWKNWRVVDKDQSAAGATDSNTMSVGVQGNAFIGFTLALKPTGGGASTGLGNPDNGAAFLYLSNGGSANPGDLFAKIKENSITKTIQIIDFNNGSLTATSSSDTLDGLDSSSFLRSDVSDSYSSGTLTLDPSTTLSLDASSSLDINSTNLSIADTNISLDGANTAFTQATGNISLVPAATHDLTTTITSGGEFRINTNDLVFNGTNARIGIGTANPLAKLDVNGTIKGLVVNGSTANFSGNSNTDKLIASGAVNGTTANFSNANFSGTTSVGKLISSGAVNGTTANFSNINASSFNFTNANITTLTSTDINNSGTSSTTKLISSGVVNGANANFSKVISSGSINGSNANFTNLIASGIFNGSPSSFDGDFTNGSVLFSNNQGVISQNNSQLYWDRTNNRLAVGLNTANEILTINGALSFKASNTPTATSDYGKIYVSSSNSRLYFQDDSGVSYSINNGALASLASPGGSNTHFQFNDGGVFGGNGALAFTKSSRTLDIASDAVLDINSTNLSIADSNISFDSASGVTFTPSAGQNLNIALATTGDFTVNTNQLYLDTSSSKIGLTTSNPNEALTINGTLSLKEGSAPSASADFGKLYVKASDSKLYFMNDSSNEYNLSNPSLNMSLNDLTDAAGLPGGLSIYIGNGSGLNAAGYAYNTAIGINSLKLNIQGMSNTALGAGALENNSNGGSNSAFGTSALYSNKRGQRNVAIGTQSLYNNSNGYYNTAIGHYSLYGNKIGIENTALGYQTLYNNANGGEYNVALGHNALDSNDSGNGNVAIGIQSFTGNSTGNYNTTIGYHSLYYISNGSYNTSEGYRSLFELKRGHYNVALGSMALSFVRNGSYNIAVGAYAGRRYGVGSNPVMSNGIHLGYNAGYYDIGDNNIFIGYNAGNGAITGSNNIIIGYNNNRPPQTANSNQLDIADTIYGDMTNQRVGIGISNIHTKLEVNGSTMTNTLVNKAVYTNSSSSNVTINWNNGNKQQITLGHNVTFSFTAPSYGIGSFSLILIQDGTGGRTVTWPSSVKWPAGVAPTLSTSSGNIDMITCLYDGTDYLCQIGLKFS